MADFMCKTCALYEGCKGKYCCDGCYKPIDSLLDNKTANVQVVIGEMLSKFGEDSQIDVAIEEMSELIKELIKYKRSKIHSREKQAASRDNVVEELGDVMFMMEYLKRIFRISDGEIQTIVEQKATRTRRRYIHAEE